MGKVTTGARVNEQPLSKQDMIQEWKRKINKGEHPFIHVASPAKISD
ncbi:hypothetical protein H6F38_20120 [Paenibacillus sp. EKM208P]|nr:hypothetical protein H6F38_20120 [Paenibacillus sp. EKM208P]